MGMNADEQLTINELDAVIARLQAQIAEMEQLIDELVSRRAQAARLEVA